MRTTVDLDEDILRAAKDLARDRSQTLGQVLSELVRKGLAPSGKPYEVRNGVPILPRLPGGRPVTSQHVKELLESED
jgi:hypothetical protein